MSYRWKYNTKMCLQEDAPGLNVMTHHKEVVKKLNLLREELVRLVQGLQEMPWEVQRPPGCKCDLPSQYPPFVVSPQISLISKSSHSVSHPTPISSLPCVSLSTASQPKFHSTTSAFTISSLFRSGTQKPASTSFLCTVCWSRRE